jgi:hypothetical protein
MLLRRAALARNEARTLVSHSRALLSSPPIVFDRHGLAHRCAWCGRLSADEVEWWDAGELPPDRIRLLRLKATHGICPDCIEDLVSTGHSRPLSATPA